MKTSKIIFLILFFLIMLVSVQAQSAPDARAALPYPTANTPKAIDLGPLATQSANTPISITIALHLRNLSEAEGLLKALHTPGDPQFRHFLTAQQFVERFAPSSADVEKTIASLAKYGLTTQRTTATTLRVTGMPADMEQAFGVRLHSYEVPAQANAPGYRFHAPLAPATMPKEIAASVAAVVGLDSRPSFRPQNRTVSSKFRLASAATPATTPDAPGLWTVTDFADYYDVQPLYSKGVTGSGRTVGIVTLASFTTSDAFAYWSALGLSVNPSRVQVVNIDGGPGVPSDASGSNETTLDVEQSGGVAPGANIIVYQAPNTNQGWVDAFAAAVEDNSADSVSTSWCTWEWFTNLENAPVIDPLTGNTVSFAQANHELFVRAAIQGQTFFAASADGGAYTVNWLLGCLGPYSASAPFSCSQPLSVDYPASDPAMTGAGGTTLPGLQEYCLNSTCTPPFYDINIPHERVWGWNYLLGLCKTLGFSRDACGIFPIGSGGGVSVMFELPFYQSFVPGMQLSQPHQVWKAGAEIGILDGVGTYYALPADYPGRNVPDISFNADPNTGYIIYYTSSVSGFEILTYWGGTSFVAPQLNGVTALLGQYLHGERVGLLNFPLYALAIGGQGYQGSGAPLHAIAYGNNWFYRGSNGYNPGVGLGTLDVWNFAEFLKHPF